MRTKIYFGRSPHGVRQYATSHRSIAEAADQAANDTTPTAAVAARPSGAASQRGSGSGAAASEPCAWADAAPPALRLGSEGVNRVECGQVWADGSAVPRLGWGGMR